LRADHPRDEDAGHHDHHASAQMVNEDVRPAACAAELARNRSRRCRGDASQCRSSEAEGEPPQGIENQPQRNQIEDQVTSRADDCVTRALELTVLKEAVVAQRRQTRAWPGTASQSLGFAKT
jgi:hypothetical protein